VIENFVLFLYTTDYDTKKKGDKTHTANSISCFKLHAQMFALAKKYAVQGLAELSAQKYQACLDSTSNSATFVRFLESIPDIYGLTPPSMELLRGISTRFARNRLRHFQEDEKSRASYEAITSAYPAFAQDVLDLFVKNCRCSAYRY
jgi:hypothetical protein